MCLAVPGKVVDVYREQDLLMGKIDFGGVARRVCLEHLPQSAVGDYVLVHVGFALAKIDQAEAEQLIALLSAMEELGEASSDGSEGAAS